ncbi:Uncharacterized conserved protein, contains NRDE domain [Malonomonas rubra DSM 5091]|uniref:Uncharacterized conserved protein, contains NRDE domain n=1 Tax=Malonomonas rubra DSM 5091 TaxID=1122189 RepID=A0A1M6E199_MALRU|nr:NRDE family protein [Malonomonas rubra]SHI79294.1 Uncharacterized conserved protein, contains NRDE domain [Malonomonas rubra DSM 5091]
MCLILFAYKYHPRYPLVVAANRDEFYQRPTRSAHWWDEHPELLAGKDLEAGGTWMGVTRKGHFAAVTNIREPEFSTNNSLSRGLLPYNYLTQAATAKDFADILLENQNRYQGFNLLFGSGDSLYYQSNRTSFRELSPGLYGLSNAQLDTPWPKVAKGKQKLAEQLKADELSTSNLLQILAAKDIADDETLPQTGVSLEWERLLSATCISAPEHGYGTRSSSVLLISHQGQVKLHEKTVAPSATNDAVFEFQL